jgi:hypothetical protein
MTDYQDLTHDLDEFWQEAGLPVEARLIFNYPDNDGAHDSWVVNVHAFTNDRENPQLRGHCLRNYDMRTFSIRHITECSDILTGQLIPDVLEHLNELYRRTAAYTFDSIVYNHVDTLRALLYIMQRSGFSPASQLGALTRICRYLGRDERVSNHHVAPVVLRYRHAEEPAFHLVVRRLGKQLSSGAKGGLLKLASRIASHNGPAESSAQNALNFMARCFNCGE